MGFSFRRLLALKDLKKKKKKMKFRSSKRKRVVVVKPSGIQILPNDVLTNILARLPVKEVTMSKCVSIYWNYLISSSDFAQVFMASKPSVRRLILCYSNVISRNRPRMLSMSVLNRVLLPETRGSFVSSLHGLLCVVNRSGSRTRFVILNRTTNQRVTSPMLKSPRLGDGMIRRDWNHFGYDPIHREYKILSINWVLDKVNEMKLVSAEYHVLTLNSRSLWRNTTGHPYGHLPILVGGVSIDGVLYYVCRIDRKKLAVMSFSFTSEDFKPIELPVDISNFILMNFNNKATVVDCSKLESEKKVDLFILVGEKKWSQKTISLPISVLKAHMNLIVLDRISLIPMPWQNEVCFVNNHKLDNTNSLVIFDLEENIIKQIIALRPLRLRTLMPGLIDFFEDGVENIIHLKT